MTKKSEKKVESDQITLKLSKTTMHGYAVKRLQEFLSLLGFFDGEIDGVFGAKTHDALKAFQENAKLKVDGMCGPITWEALVGVVDKSR